MSVSVNDFRAGMRQMTAAVNVVTSVLRGERSGMTATAVMSVTAEPPLLAVAVNRTNTSYRIIKEAGIFAVNVLPLDHIVTAKLFGSAGRGDERFLGGDWDTLITGAPTLLRDATCFDCRVEQTIDFSSHAMFVGLVEAIRVNKANAPLLYVDGTYASIAPDKDNILDAYEQIIVRVSMAIDDALGRPMSPNAQLSLFSSAFSSIINGAKQELRTFFQSERLVPQEQLQRVNQRKREIEIKLQQMLEVGSAVGEFEVDDPGVTAHAIIGLINSIHRWADTEEAKTAGDVNAYVLRLVESMVAPRRW